MGRATVDAAGGRDAVVLQGDPDALRGGPGRDRVTVAGFFEDLDTRVVYDLGLEQLTRGYRTVPFEVEVLHVRAMRRGQEQVLVRGSARRDVVTVAACGAAVLGGPGRDRLRADSGRCGKVRTSLRGGRGADVLLGGGGPDVLLGGSGRDRAAGLRGFDLWPCRG